MKKNFAIIAALLVLCLMIAGLLMVPFSAWAANTVTQEGGIVEITNIDSDWSWSDTFSGVASGMRLISIQFNPGDTDDVLVVENGSASGPRIFYSKCVDDYDQRVKYFNRAITQPVLDFSDCTLSAGSTVIFVFDY